MLYCPECGAERELDSKYCSACGTSFEDSPVKDRKLDIKYWISEGHKILKPRFSLVLTYMSIGILIRNLVAGGIIYMTLKKLRGEQKVYHHLFAGLSFWPSLVLSQILMSIIIYLGYCLFLVPGIYLSVAFLFVTPLIVDQKLGVLSALAVSREVIHKHWFLIFRFAIRFYLELVIYFVGFYITAQYFQSDILFIISLLIYAFILYRIIHTLCRFASSIAVAYHCVFPLEEFLRFKRDSIDS